MQKIDCELLYKLFLKIKEKGLFKGLTNNPGEVGLNFEKLIGNTGGDFNIPDFRDIEIKCINTSKNTDVCLFSSAPYGSVPFPILKLAQKYIRTRRYYQQIVIQIKNANLVFSIRLN